MNDTGHLSDTRTRRWFDRWLPVVLLAGMAGAIGISTASAAIRSSRSISVTVKSRDDMVGSYFSRRQASTSLIVRRLGSGEKAQPRGQTERDRGRDEESQAYGKGGGTHDEQRQPQL